MSNESTLVSAIRDLADGSISDRAARIDSERMFPADSCRDLASMGAFGLMAGGGDANLTSLSLSCEAVGGACASTGMVFLMHSITTATVVGGGGERSQELLERLCGGEIGTLAFSERGTGAHFYAPDISVERDGDQLFISGRKSLVTSGGHADIYLILVGTENGDGADCYAIERGAPGVSFSGEWSGLGMTLLAASSLQPAELSEAAREVDSLLVTMDRNRTRRLIAAGFDEATARHLSELHTPNLM